jgi:hypothetical protein
MMVGHQEACLGWEIGLIIGPIHHNTKLADKKALSGQGRAAPSRGSEAPGGQREPLDLTCPTSAPAEINLKETDYSVTFCLNSPMMRKSQNVPG